MDHVRAPEACFAKIDLWIGQRKIENVDLARDIPEAWMNRIRGVAGVASVAPYIVGKGTATQHVDFGSRGG